MRPSLAEAMPMIKVVLPKTPAVAGELVPIQIKAYLREGVGARNAGRLTAVGDAFTVSGLGQAPTRAKKQWAASSTTC